MGTQTITAAQYVAQWIHNEYSECVICNSPLGQESKDYGFPFCHECRMCKKCGKPLDHTEAKEAWRTYLLILDPTEQETPNPEHARSEVIHSYCRILDPDATITIKRSDWEILNVLRLAITPDLELSDVTNENQAIITYSKFLQINKMDHEMLLIHGRMLEACAAQAKIALSQNAEHRNEIQAQRKKKFDKIEKDRQASLKAAAKEAPAKEPSSRENKRVAVETFMEVFGLSDYASAKTLFNERQKFIDAQIKYGMTEVVARETVNAMLVSQGRLNAPKEGKQE